MDLVGAVKGDFSRQEEVCPFAVDPLTKNARQHLFLRALSLTRFSACSLECFLIFILLMDSLIFQLPDKLPISDGIIHQTKTPAFFSAGRGSAQSLLDTRLKPPSSAAFPWRRPPGQVCELLPSPSSAKEATHLQTFSAPAGRCAV
jgi:hypothetical protein